MNPRPELVAEAARLRRQLTRRGIVVLAVVADPITAGWLTVYLHGLAGNEQQVAAVAFLTAWPGVREVRVSEQSWTILRVYREPETLA